MPWNAPAYPPATTPGPAELLTSAAILTSAGLLASAARLRPRTAGSASPAPSIPLAEVLAALLGTAAELLA